MTIHEARKEQIKSLKNRSLRERFSFFREYYGIKTVCLLTAVVLTVMFVVTLATKKDFVFSGVFFGGAEQASADGYWEDFAAAAGIDLKKQDISVQTQPDIRMDQPVTTEVYQAMEAFTAMVAAKSVDCFGGNTEIFLHYAYMGYAADLRTVLPTEALTRLAPALRYIDGQLLREQAEGENIPYSQYPDPAKPEQMAEPIPVAIALEAASDDFRESYRFAEGAVLGICANSEQPENVRAFLNFCFGS